MTSARIPEEDASHRARNLCVFSRVQRGTPRLTHKGRVLQRVFLDAISDVMVVLGMRQSIVLCCDKRHKARVSVRDKWDEKGVFGLQILRRSMSVITIDQLSESAKTKSMPLAQLGAIVHL